MEARAVRRHALFALGLALLVIASMRFARQGPDLGLRGAEDMMVMAALVLGMFGHFYTSGRWRRACESIALCLLAAAIALRIAS